MLLVIYQPDSEKPLATFGYGGNFCKVVGASDEITRYILRGALIVYTFLGSIIRMAALNKVLNDMRLLLSHFEVLI